MLKRFSISLEEELLDIFDDVIRQRQYENRSEALRDLIRKAFVQNEWEADKEVMGVISLVYDHHHRLLQEKLTEIQHDSYQQILSTTHIHVDHHNCLEVIIGRGKAGQIKELADRFAAQKGVKDMHLAMSSTGEQLH